MIPSMALRKGIIRIMHLPFFASPVSLTDFLFFIPYIPP
jgi:hypothetical protein